MAFKVLLYCVTIIILLIPFIACGKRVKRIVGGKQAAAPPIDDPVVFTHVYSRDARIEGLKNTKTGLYTFFGIRYAEPPVGNNRFLRPKYKRLEGDLTAIIFGPPCPQPDPNDPNKVIGHENCLLLNIFTPQMPDETTGLPVLVWIHGGGYRYGSASQYGVSTSEFKILPNFNYNRFVRVNRWRIKM